MIARATLVQGAIAATDGKPKPVAPCASGKGMMIARIVTRGMIDDAPTITAEYVRHGYWQGESDGYADGYPVYDVWYCSECEHCIDDGTDDPALLPYYCPNCGTKMDAKEDDHVQTD